MSPQSAVDDDLFRKVALVVGFLAVAGSALVARASPATGYELSIYAMTSPLVWAGLVIALSVALTVAFVPSSNAAHVRGHQSLALVLGGLVMAVFAGLPIIRGYKYVGHHDALTHLGWARALSEGTITPFDLYYPGIHTVGVMIHSALGIPLTRSMLFAVLLPVIVFLVFVPLCVGTIVPERRAVVIGAFAGFLLLPITTISMYLEAHAMTQAVLLSAVFLYLFTKYLRTDRGGSYTAVGVALLLVSMALVIYHPQLVAHLIVVLLGISAIQFLARRVSTGSRIASQTTVYGQTGFLIVLFVLWTATDGFFSDIALHFVGSAVEFLLTGVGGAGDSIATQGASIQGAGGSLLEIFFKLFFPHLLFTLITAVVVLGALVRWNRFDDVRAETLYFTVGLVGLTVLFGVYFVTSGSMMHFRVLGLMMLFATIIGAIGIHHLTAADSTESRSWFAGSRQPLLAVGFAVLLVLSLAAVFPSPYTYNASSHVSESTLNGYATAFDSSDDDVDFVGLRNGPNRYDDAVNGNEERMRFHTDVSDDAVNEGLPGQLDDDRYLVLTQSDYDREVIAYNELRYSEADLDSLSDHPDIDHIQSNGEFDMYYVHAETAA
ncbi:hypothetical protein [Natronorubrum thiooxidans]|uniref:Dolichyl-phosphate-mannose-protein mannosyltransferase n=1 Tax=Natronorubrum thiooxidans TaxID=308853 RepID=A0A1N7FK71_9EURY|nr:hypothetical protein [Natronorubrum thiooxidans]SIS00674.1 hypothetical protein SAMN05421752_10757 [Natronorubrum thiooxidans]